MSAKYSTKLLLAFRSGGQCAFTKCLKELTVDAPSGGKPVVLGEAAHIAGENPTAARYDHLMTDSSRNDYENLMYLCGDHHTQIDKQEASFPISLLKAIKKEHEEKVRSAMNEAFAEVGFPELALATQWVQTFDPSGENQDYALSAPDAKIKKNGLANGSRLTITMGLSVAKLVGEFIQHEAQLDQTYPEKLKAGFLEVYFGYRKKGIAGDDLFDLMCEFAQRGMNKQVGRSAGLAVLVYLFEKCDVFEK